MRDVAIVGGGLAGLVLARQLMSRGVDCALYDARTRLGGRILTHVTEPQALPIDLGPSWFWPASQPLLSALIAELGLRAFPQHDEGDVLVLHDPDKKPEILRGESVHAGAQRIEGGMGRLVSTIAGALDAKAIHLGHVLTALTDRGDHVDFLFATAEGVASVSARRVVLALPPRLIAEGIAFTPQLDDFFRDVLGEAGTWMAAQAKAAMVYEAARWRAESRSGNAFVSHEQAVLGEVFDACGPAGVGAALAGFVALSPDHREHFSAGLNLLIANQMGQLFGPALEQGEVIYQDWACEPFTCSHRDRQDPRRPEDARFANPLLRSALWESKLFFGGSETAANEAGYLEGAVDAAERIARTLTRGTASQTPDRDASVNAASLRRFTAWAAAQVDPCFDRYRAHLTRALSGAQKDQLTQRAILTAVEEMCASALAMLNDLPFNVSDVPVERGRSALMTDVQAPFRDVLKALVDDVLAFNRTSCALSNFPDEHHLPKDYMQTILRDIAAAWQEFSLAANRLLLAKEPATS